MVIPDEQLKAIVHRANLVDENKLAELEVFARENQISLADAIVEKNIIADENLGILVADALHVPFIVLSKFVLSPEIAGIIPERVARKHHAIPFAVEQGMVKVAMTNPSDAVVREMIERKTGLRVSVYLATDRDMYAAYRIYQKNLQKSFDELIEEEVKRTGSASSNVPVAKIVDLIINYAYNDHSSDIHIEPEENNSLVRFRIDGVLHDVLFLPKSLHEQIISRIKVLSRLRTDEHLSPQDGKMRMQLEEEDLDIRVSILPVVDGEKAVLRLLASRVRQFSLLDLGMTEKDLQKVTRGFSKPFGMVLSTGPTGSGKTTSIYAIVKTLNIREKNIMTIEDPVEYKIKGVNQIHVNAKTNLTFANGLRSILRQDPNIIFVGEIRDSETAQIAVNAALTGHLVLSTLHTNNAGTTLPRLIDMGVEPFLVASTVNVIFSQRLVRKICEMCKISLTVEREKLLSYLPKELIDTYFDHTQQVRLYKGAGCNACHMTGYNGRVAIFEVLEITKKIRDYIVEKKDADVIEKAAIEEGMRSILENGLEKAAAGLTTVEEVLRVTEGSEE